MFGFLGRPNLRAAALESGPSPWSLPFEEVSSGFKTGEGVFVEVFLLTSVSGGPGGGPLAVRGVTVVGGLWLAAGLSQAARLDPTASSSEHAGSSSGTVPCWHCGWGRGGCP